MDQLPRRQDGGAHPGHGQAHVPGAGTQGRPADQPRSTRHTWRPGHDLDRGLPLVPVPGPARQQPGHIGIADQPAPGDGVDQGTEADIGHLHLAGQVGAGTEQQAGFERRESHRGRGPHGPAAIQHLARQAGNP